MEGKKIIICRGSHGRRFPFPGSECAVTHHDVWSLKRLPESVVIVGDGATGTPMAMIFSAFGIKVKLFEASHRLLAREDATISQLMTEAFSKRGIEVTCGIGGIESIEKE